MAQLLEKFGRVRHANINRHIQVGFVTMEDAEHARAAVEQLHDTEFEGRHIFVDYAAKVWTPYPPHRDARDRDRRGDDRYGGGGGGGGGRRSRSRDRSRERDRRRRSRSRSGSRSGSFSRSHDRAARDGYRGPPGGGGYDRRGPPGPGQPGPGGAAGFQTHHLPGAPGPPGENRLLMLPSPRGRPAFEAYQDEVERLRELVDLMQRHLPPVGEGGVGWMDGWRLPV